MVCYCALGGIVNSDMIYGKCCRINPLGRGGMTLPEPAGRRAAIRPDARFSMLMQFSTASQALRALPRADAILLRMSRSFADALVLTTATPPLSSMTRYICRIEEKNDFSTLAQLTRVTPL